MKNDEILIIRLPKKIKKLLETRAILEHKTMSELIREKITEYTN